MVGYCAWSLRVKIFLLLMSHVELPVQDVCLISSVHVTERDEWYRAFWDPLL